jgi:hypothetical protein
MAPDVRLPEIARCDIMAAIAAAGEIITDSGFLAAWPKFRLTSPSTTHYTPRA